MEKLREKEEKKMMEIITHLQQQLTPQQLQVLILSQGGKLIDRKHWFLSGGGEAE
jgi:hypothetical protein